MHDIIHASPPPRQPKEGKMAEKSVVVGPFLQSVAYVLAGAVLAALMGTVVIGAEDMPVVVRFLFLLLGNLALGAGIMCAILGLLTAKPKRP